MIAPRRIQEALAALGYSLGRWGVDGYLGADTTAAIAKYQHDCSLSADGICGPVTWASVEHSLALLEPEPTTTLSPGSGIVDRSGMHAHPKLYSARRTPRPWSQITGVTLHQMGVKVAERPARLDTMGTHIGVLCDGRVVISNGATEFVWHGMGLSHHTIGIEFNGTGELTDAQIASANDVLFPYLHGCFRAHNQPWTRVHAHRQSTASRLGCPGAEIWRRVGVPWIARLRALGYGASDGGPGWTTGKGNAIPASWL